MKETPSRDKSFSTSGAVIAVLREKGDGANGKHIPAQNSKVCLRWLCLWCFVVDTFSQLAYLLQNSLFKASSFKTSSSASCKLVW